MNQAIKIYCFSLVLVPLVAIFSNLFFGYGFVYHLYGIVALALYALSKKNRRIDYLYLAILIFLYYFSWDLVNGNLNKFGVVKTILRREHLYIFAIIYILDKVKFSPREMFNFIRFIDLTIIVSAVISLYQLFIDPKFLSPPEFDEIIELHNIYLYRRTSIFGQVDPNEIGLSFLPLLSIQISYKLFRNQNLPWVWITLGGMISFISNSRYVMIGFLIILLQLLLYSRFKMRNYVRLIGIIMFTSLTIYTIFVRSGFEYKAYMEERILADIDPEENSRIFAFEVFSKYFPQKPFFGTGQHVTEDIAKDLSGRSNQVHVGFLSHLITYGIFGSLLLFGFWYYILRRLYRQSKATKNWGAFFGFLMIIWANFTLVHYSMFHYGLILCLIYSNYLFQRTSPLPMAIDYVKKPFAVK